MNKKIKTLFSYLMIIIGAILASFSVACILLPNDAIDYGTAGIAIIISKLTDYNLSLCVLLVFLPFLIAGENKTLICYVNYFELQRMKTIISQNKGTFSTVSTIEEILR